MKKKIFTLLTLLLCAVTSSWASTVGDLKTLSDNHKVYFEDIVSAKVNAGTLFDSDYLIALAGGCGYASNKGTDGTVNKKYCLRVKSTTQDVIAFKVGDECTLVIYADRAKDRTPILNTKIATTGDDVIEGTVTVTSGNNGYVSYTIPSAGTYYIIGSGDCFLAGLEFTFAAAPAKAYTVTAATNNSNYGTAAADASSLDEGETTEITATPKTGYEFTSWAVEGTGASLSSTTTNPTTLTMGTANATVTATFSAINYTIAHNAATGGTYTVSVAGGDATDANTTATVGQEITLAGTATDPAHTYVVWNVKDANDNDVAVANNKFTMPASNVTIAPVFSEPLNTLFSMTSITSAGGIISKGTTASVTATFSEGGSAEVYQNASSGDMCYSGSINLNGSGSSYLHISFPSALQAGDVITATFLDDDQDWKLSKTASGAQAQAKANPYTIAANDALLGATELYIFKNNKAQVSALKIEGRGEISDLAVTSSTTPSVVIGVESAIDYTTSSTGAVTFESSDESVATVSNAGVITGVGGGTATITITQEADETYRVGVAKVTVTILETAMIKVKLNGGTSATVTGTLGGTADVQVQSDKKFGSGHYAGFTLANSETLQTGDVINVKITQVSQNGTITIYDSDKTTVLYDTGEIGVVGDNKFVLPAEVNGKSTIYICRTNANGWNAYVDYIAVYRPDAIVNLNADGFATYSAGSNFEYVGADAYTMELDMANSKLTGTKLDAGTKIPAGAGILLKGTAGAQVSIVNTNSASALENNNLHGTTDNEGNTVVVPGGKTIYVLSGDTFKKYTGASFVANKAFFQIDGTDVEGREFVMSFDDGQTTGIADVRGKMSDVRGDYFDLSGRKVAQPTKGLYIVNGKKVVIK